MIALLREVEPVPPIQHPSQALCSEKMVPRESVRTLTLGVLILRFYSHGVTECALRDVSHTTHPIHTIYGRLEATKPERIVSESLPVRVSGLWPAPKR